MTMYELQFSVIIPFFNEEESLKELHDRIVHVMTTNQYSYEIIFIDDGSVDRSALVIEDLIGKNDHIRFIQLRKNFGKSAALAQGFRAAQGEFVITMDADLQDDPEEIPKLLQKIYTGFDLVSGWKKDRKDPFIKRTTSKIYNFFTSLFSGLSLHDFNCGLKIYRNPVVKSLNLYGELHRYLPVIAAQKGFRVTELEVKHHARKYGHSKFGLARFTRGAFDLLTITFLTKYRTRPLHLFGSIGFITFLTGFILLVILIYQRIFQLKYLSDRPILFIAILMVIVGIQFFSIGLLGEMITSMRKQETGIIKKTRGFKSNIF